MLGPELFLGGIRVEMLSVQAGQFIVGRKEAES